jgi:hypothetical protein
MGSSCQVVVFVKGTRQQPQCGFSQRMMSILTTLKARRTGWPRPGRGSKRPPIPPMQPIRIRRKGLPPSRTQPSLHQATRTAPNDCIAA